MAANPRKVGRPFAPIKPPSAEETWQRVIIRARFNPVWFAEEILQLRRMGDELPIEQDPDHSWELDTWQREMLEACGDIARKAYGVETVINHLGKKMVTIAACQGPGKTFGAAMVLHWFQFAFPGVAVCTAPKLAQVTTRLFKEFRKIQHRAMPGYAQLMDVAATRITWGNDPRWFAIAETGATPESLQGWHEKYLLLICDEASGIPDEMIAVIRGAMSTGVVVMCLLIGNPTRLQGAFANSHRMASLTNDYYRMHVSFEHSKRVKRTWVDQMAREYGTASPVYKIRCLGQFAETSASQVISPDWLIEARLRGEKFMETDGSVGRIRVSIDVADGGDDKSVVTVMKHWQSRRIALKQKQFSFEGGLVTSALAEEAIRLYLQFGGDRKRGDDFVVDSNGVGAGVHDYIYRKGYPVLRFMGGAGSASPDRWRNRRVQGYMALRDELRDGLLGIAPDFLSDNVDDFSSSAWDEFDAQMCSITYRPGSDRVDDLLAKEDMKRNGVKSPDRADSLMMQYATIAPTISKAGAAPDVKEMPSLMVQTHNHWQGMFDGN